MPAEEILRTLRSARRRERLLESGVRAGWSVLAVALVTGAAVTLDRVAVLPPAMRMALSALVLSAIAGLAAWVMAVWLRRRPLTAVAARIERAAPELGEALVSSASLALAGPDSRLSTQLLDKLHAATEAGLRTVELRRVFGAAGCRRAGVAALAACAAVAIVWWRHPEASRQLLARLVQPHRDLPRPSTTLLEVTPGNARLARGADLTIAIRLVRGAAGAATLSVLSSSVSVPREVLPLEGGAATRAFAAVRRDFDYQVFAGDYASPVYSVRVREAPRPLEYTLQAHPPAYAGRAAATTVSPAGDIIALKGSRVDLAVRASEALSSAVLAFPGGARLPAAAIDGNTARFEAIAVEKPGAYRLQLATLDGVSNGEGLESSIRPLADRPPSVEVLEPRAAEILLEEAAAVDVRLDARDDVGIAALELGVQLDGRPTEWSPLEPGAVSHRLDARRLGAGAGAVATVVFRARDALAQEGQSGDLAIRIAALPPPPEGSGWPAPMRRLVVELGVALDDWARLLPAPGGEVPGELAADAAHVETMMRASSNTLGAVAFWRRVAATSAAVASAIAVPSPNQPALAGLGRRVETIADGDAAAFWAEAALVGGKLREAVETTRAPVPCARLFALHHAVGARLDETLSAARRLLAAEELEELVEKSLALERAAIAPPSRRRPLAGEATLLAAALTSAAPYVPAAADLEAAARDLVEVVAPAIDRGDAAAMTPLPALRARLQARYEREEAAAVQARARLSAPPDCSPQLAGLAAAVDGAAFLIAAQRASAALAGELALVQSREYADLESTADLALLREAVERLADARMEGAGEPVDRGCEECDEITALYAAARPSRTLGAVVQALDRAASAQDDAGFRLRGAAAWNSGTLRQLARLEREIRRLAAALDGRLQALAEDAAATSAAPGLGAARSSLQRAAALLEECETALAPDGPAAADVPRAQSAAARAGAVLAELPQALEALRPGLAPGAPALRERLRARQGTVAGRVARLAASQQAIAGGIRELALSPDGADFRPRLDAASRTQERNRAEIERTALQARAEGDRMLDRPGMIERLRIYDRAATELADVAINALSPVSAALRAAAAQGTAARSGTLIEAADRAARAAARLGAVAEALGAAAAEAMLDDVARELAAALQSASSGAGPDVPPDAPAIARDARICLQAALKAAQALALQAAADPRKQPLLALLREAAEHFQRAAALADAMDTAGGSEALRVGRARLDEAVALAEKLRGEARRELADDRRRLEKDAGGQTTEQSKTASRELEAAYAELEKLLELERLEREIAERMEELLQGGAAGRAQRQDLEQKERELQDGLKESHMTTGELVELVSRLVAIDRDGRELAANERTLAADAERVLAAGAAPAEVAALRQRQSDALEGARRAAEAFQGAGLKLSAVLPHVLRAYWQAGEATQPALRAIEAARDELEPGGAPMPALLAAAEKLDAWMAGVGEVRHQALEAIADQERGGQNANAAQSSLERARRGLAEAARLARQGDQDGAQRARKQSIRSIADAASALRTRIADLTLPGGEEGGLMSRLLDAEAARLGLGWSVATRGGSLAGAARLSQSGAADMPFPAAYRQWVKVYLQAIEEDAP